MRAASYAWQASHGSFPLRLYHRESVAVRSILHRVYGQPGGATQTPQHWGRSKHGTVSPLVLSHVYGVRGSRTRPVIREVPEESLWPRLPCQAPVREDAQTPPSPPLPDSVPGWTPGLARCGGACPEANSVLLRGAAPLVRRTLAACSACRTSVTDRDPSPRTRRCLSYDDHSQRTTNVTSPGSSVLQRDSISRVAAAVCCASSRTTYRTMTFAARKSTAVERNNALRSELRSPAVFSSLRGHGIRRKTGLRQHLLR